MPRVFAVGMEAKLRVKNDCELMDFPAGQGL